MIQKLNVLLKRRERKRFDVNLTKISVKKTKTTSKASALLAVSLSGEKLIPLLVFIAQAKNGKVKKETDDYDRRNVYDVSPKGFSDTPVMNRLLLADYYRKCQSTMFLTTMPNSLVC
jgi:hypothetical protein